MPEGRGYRNQDFWLGMSIDDAQLSFELKVGEISYGSVAVV